MSNKSHGIGVIKVAHPELIPEMAEQMLSVIKSEVQSGNRADFLLFNVYDPDYSLGYMGFCGNDMGFTENVMDAAFSGSEEKQGEFYVSSPSLSRKTDMIPPIDNYLNSCKKAAK